MGGTAAARYAVLYAFMVMVTFSPFPKTKVGLIFASYATFRSSLAHRGRRTWTGICRRLRRPRRLPAAAAAVKQNVSDRTA